MSFLLFATAAAVVAAATGLLAARRSGKRDDEEEAAAPKLPTEAGAVGEAKKPSLSASLPISLEEVVAVEADDPSKRGIGKAYVERWLAGALAMTEDGVVIGAVFIAPEGLKSEAVVAFAAPRKDIGWLSPVDVELAGEPPSALEIGGVVMQRKRRLFVKLERLGNGAPRIGTSAIFAEYRATGRAMGIVLKGDDATLAWSGLRYDAGEYERWGRG